MPAARARGSQSSRSGAVVAMHAMQWVGYAGSATLASFGLYQAYTQRHNSQNSNHKESCSCHLVPAKPKPYCDLVQTDEDEDRSKFNLLFCVVCVWIGLLSLFMLAREVLAGRRSRSMGAVVFLAQGSLLVAVGREFNDVAFVACGAVQCALALVLVGSIPACKSTEQEEEQEQGEEPLLLQQDDQQRSIY